MAIEILAESYDGSVRSISLRDGDRLAFTVDYPTRIEHANDAIRSFAKALGSHYDLRIIVKPRA